MVQQEDDMPMIDEEYPERCGCVIMMILLACVSLVIAISLSGCNITRKAVSDGYNSDSVSVNKIIIHDTTTITNTEVSFVRDTAFVTKWDTTFVSFVPGGGTYNISTGEATGVIGVSKKEQITELTAKVESLKAELAYYKGHSNTSIDSVVVNTSSYHSEEERQSESGVWWWLFPLGVVTGIAIVFVLKYVKAKFL